MRNKMFRCMVSTTLACALVLASGGSWTELIVSASMNEETALEGLVSETETETNSESNLENETLSEAVTTSKPEESGIENSGADASGTQGSESDAGDTLPPSEATGGTGEDSSTADQSSQPQTPPGQELPVEIISPIADAANQPQDPASAGNKLTFAFAKDPAIIPSALTAETYNEETLKTVTLLDGVTVKDESGNNVQPWVSDLGGFTVEDLGSVGKTFVITYSAKHPVSGAVQTATLNAVIGQAGMRAARAAFTITASAADAGAQLQNALNSTDAEITININGSLLYLNKALTIDVTNKNKIIHLKGFSTTTIQPSYSGFNSADSRLLHIRGNGSLTLNFTNITLKGSDKVGGIRIWNGSNVTMNKVTIVEGAAIANTPDQDYYGGAIRVESSGKLTLNDATLKANRANTHGGAIAVMDSANATISNSMLQSNIAQNGGGVFIGMNANAALTGTTVKRNMAKNGGGLYVLNNGSFGLVNCSIDTNHASDNGGGLYMEPGTNPRNISGNTFVTNEAHINGGAVYIDSNNAINFSNGATAFNRNSAYKYGGAIFINRGAASFDQVTFYWNEAHISGGAVYVTEAGRINNAQQTRFERNSAFGKGQFDGGGAIYTEDKNYSNVTTQPNTIFTGNTCWRPYYASTPAHFAHTSIKFSSTSYPGTHAINNRDVNAYHVSSSQVLKLVKVPTLVDYGKLTIPEAMQDKWRKPITVQYSNTDGAYNPYAIVVESSSQNWDLSVNIAGLKTNQGVALSNTSLAYRKNGNSYTNGSLFSGNTNTLFDSTNNRYGLKWNLDQGEGLMLNPTQSGQIVPGDYKTVITWNLTAAP